MNLNDIILCLGIVESYQENPDVSELVCHGDEIILPLGETEVSDNHRDLLLRLGAYTRLGCWIINTRG